ncbi:MAG: hypothetical protein MZW92_65825 [Comamonadaceae bacterium]|nr:hypothetical protein [Comamonadaceae bacterium]
MPANRSRQGVVIGTLAAERRCDGREAGPAGEGLAPAHGGAASAGAELTDGRVLRRVPRGALLTESVDSMQNDDSEQSAAELRRRAELRVAQRLQAVPPDRGRRPAHPARTAGSPDRTADAERGAAGVRGTGAGRLAPSGGTQRIDGSADRPAHGGTRRGARGRRCGQPRKERIPFEHEPRTAHADERRDRHGRARVVAGDRCSADRLAGQGPQFRCPPADGHQRHPGHREDRGTATAHRARGVQAGQTARIRHRRADARSGQARAGLRCRGRRGTGAAAASGRREAAGPDPAEPGGKRREVHGQGRRAHRCPSAGGNRRRADRPIRDPRQRHRHRVARPGTAVSRLLAGRGQHVAQLRGHRAGAVDQQADGPPDGWTRSACTANWGWAARSGSRFR